MAGGVQFVTRARRVAQMPLWAAQFADLVQYVGEKQGWQELDRRLRFAGKRGFPVLDLAVFFLALACGVSCGGIRGFRRSIDGVAMRLAAMAARARLPTAASVSRALQAADRIADLDGQVAWLLSQGASVRELVRSPLVQDRDARGEHWTVLDFDPSVIALRQRALPEGEDLPAPQRRAAKLCAPGYSGRHRGETQVSTAILSHTGAGLFVQATTHAGNTPFADALGIAAEAGASLADACELPRDHMLIRFDGAGGYGEAMAQVAGRGLHYLTRLKNLHVLSEPGVAEHLAAATWHDVADSRSGPRRQATELGRYAVSEQGPGGVVTARLVVSRFASRDGRKHGAGMLMGEVQYEVFATDLDAAAWPAAEAVTLYYGRAGQENQFGQAIAQMRLGDIFSFDLCGQRLATVLLMWVNNLRLTRAAALAGDLGPAPPQQARPMASVQPSDSPPEAALTELPAQQPAPAPETVDASAPAEPAAASTESTADLPLAAQLTCPSGKIAPLHNIRASHGQGCYAIYRMPPGACRLCPQRADCTRSPNPAFRRDFCMPLPVQALADREQILAEIRAGQRVVLVQPARPPRPRTTPTARTAPPSPPPVIAPRWTSPQVLGPGPLLPTAPSLQPTVLAQLWQHHHAGFAVDVRITVPLPRPPSPPWLATSRAQRQQRRQTWTARNQFNVMRGSATVSRHPLVADPDLLPGQHKVA